MARHSGATFALRLSGLAFGFLYAVAAARLLGPSGYGVVAVAMSAATVLATVALLGIDGLAVRETAALTTRKEWGELRRFLRWACLSVLGSSTVAALLLACASLIPGPYGNALLLSSMAVPLFGGLLLLRAVIQGTGNVIAAQVPSEVVRWVVTLSLMAILILQDIATPGAVILVVLVALTVSVAASAGVLRHFLSRLPMHRGCSRLQRNWARQASPFLAIAVFAIVGTEITTLLLGWLAGPREAGLYQPIAKLSPLMLLVSHSVETVLAPRIVRMWEIGDRRDLQRLMRRSAVASLIGTVLVVSTILVASPWILGAFGEEFTRYQPYLYLIGAAQVANAALGASPLLLAMVGSMRSRLQAQVATVVIQAGLGIALIPVMGAAGAVISLVAAILTWATLHWLLAWRATGIDTSSFGTLHLLKRPA